MNIPAKKRLHILLEPYEEIVLMKALFVLAAQRISQPPTLELFRENEAGISLLRKLGAQLYEKGELEA